MADFYQTHISSYFPVNDEELFREITEQLGVDDYIPNGSNQKRHRFACEGELAEFLDEGRYPEENNEEKLTHFFRDLQALLPEGEAICISSVGNEDLLSNGASYTVITKKGFLSHTLVEMGSAIARFLLGDVEYELDF